MNWTTRCQDNRKKPDFFKNLKSICEKLSGVLLLLYLFQIQIRSRSDQIRFRSDQIWSDSNQIRSDSDQIRSDQIQIKFKTDLIQIRSDQIRFN
jgi:hypothetical protein